MMNRQGERKLGKSRIRELLTQLGIPTTKKTGMQVDRVWMDEMLEQRMQDVISNLSDVVLTKDMTRQERKEAFLKAIDKQQNV
jgi:hypothetical protein